MPRLIDSIAGLSGIMGHPPEPVIGLAEGETRWRVMTRECMHERGPMTVVILRESGVSSTLRLIDFIAGVSGILGLLSISDDCGIARRYLREHPSLTPKLVALKALALTFLIAQVVTCRRRALS
jgi:hypothetical protein